MCILLIMLGTCQDTNSGDKDEPQFENSPREFVDNDCEIGKTEAEMDFEKDSLGWYFYGLPNPRFNTWSRIISEEYDLQRKGGGDVITRRGECYNEQMKIKIKEKFGMNAFDRISNKVDSLYSIGQGDRDAEFVGGDSSLMKYIYCRIGNQLFSENDDSAARIIVQFRINREGDHGNFKIMYENEEAKSNPEYKNEVIQIMQGMPKWTPGIVNGIKQEFQYNLPIKFDISTKNEYCG